MIKKITIILSSIFTGFIVPTLAFAITDEPPAITSPKYIYQLSYEDAEGAVSFALADKGAGGKVAATIIGHSNDALFSYNRPISVEIRGLQYDKATARWNASLMFVSGKDIVSAMPVAGRFEEVIEVPVLKRQVRSGDVIKETDIEIRDVALSRTRSDTITDMASLIGKSPARTVSPERPIREHEIASPALVKKNGMVQVRYSSPGMEITTTAQAMEEGAKGSLISVRNVESKKIIRAMVEDENTVSIVTGAAQAAVPTGEKPYAAN